MSFDDFIADLVGRCPGALTAAIIDADGIPVAAVPNDGSIELLGGELASLLREVAQAGRELQHGELRQLVMHAEHATIVVTTLAPGYFLLLVLGPEGQTGRARFLARVAAEHLYSEFI